MGENMYKAYKYKIGDKVKVIDSARRHWDCSGRGNGKMAKLCGKIVTIMAINKGSTLPYRIEESPYCYWRASDFIELKNCIYRN